MNPLVRVLIVTDDFFVGGTPRGGFLRWADQSANAATGDSARQFHLGEFTRCLSDTKWVGFDVELTRAHRATAGTNGMTEAQLKADRGADVIGFRFDQPFTVSGQSRTLADYDMALFFSILVDDPDPGLAGEAEAIAQFMENGGGFFATGDHANLGATLSGLVPRVRSMRRWWSPNAGPNGEPVAPPPLGAQRHDTTRAGADNVTNFEDQSDDVPQDIAPALYFAGFAVVNGYPATKNLPHPLLCSPDGRVTVLPDHMHEGWVEVPDKLAARTFTLAGNSVREYPDYIPDNPPTGYVPAPLAPEVVATGTVLAGVTSPALDPAHVGDSTPAQGTTFGVIGAWDGHRVGKGRVVVDSTWHHFLDINLSGDRFLEDDNLPVSQHQKLRGFYVLDNSNSLVPNDAYQMIMWYYRNIVYWLIPANRHHTIWWYSLSHILKRPRLAEELGGLREEVALRDLRFDHILYFGQLAEAYLADAQGHCAKYIVRKILYKPKIPWWEWIQDVWDPIEKVRDPIAKQREQWLGAIGAAPRQELALTLTLGAALVTVAAHRELFTQKGADARIGATLDAAFTKVLSHAISEYGKVLAAGAAVGRSLEKAVAAPLSAR